MLLGMILLPPLTHFALCFPGFLQTGSLKLREVSDLSMVTQALLI